MRLTALSLPFVLLAGVEGVLRLSGFGGYPSLFVEAGPAPEGTVVRVNTDWSRQFFPGAAGEVGICQESAFVVPKPPHTVRVFLVGASFAKGWPHTPGLTAAAFLERKLQQAWPDRDVEVINLGTTAVASFPVVRMTVEALRYEPDLVIVCTAHNEFYGACGVASVHAGGSSTMIRLSHDLRKLGMVQVITGFSRTSAASNREDRNALIERMAAEDQIAPNDARRGRAVANLSAHLSEIVALCADHQVPLMLCTLPSNERDLAPVGRDLAPPVAEPDRARFDEALNNGQARLPTDAQAALASLRQAQAIFADHAQLQYALAQTYEKLGDPALAAGAYVRARDLDPMPWRASSRMNDAIRQLAADSEVRLADLETVFREHSPAGVIGWQLMDDHVHPSVRGQALVAHAITQALIDAPSGPRLTTEQLARLGTLDDWVAESGDNVCEQYRTAWLMQSLFSRPPLDRNNASAAGRFGGILAKCLAGADPVIAEALRWWVQPEQEAVRQQSISGVVGKLCAQSGRLDLAEPLFEMARREAPRFSSGRLDYALTLLTCRAQLHGELTEADRALAKRELADGQALAAWNDAETAHLTLLFVGKLWGLLGGHEQAIGYLDRARALDTPGTRQQVDLALCRSYIALGQPEQARRILAQARGRGQYGPAHAALERQLSR